MGCFLHYAFSSKKKNLRSRRGRSDGPRPCADPGGHSPAYSDSGAFPQLEALLDIFNHTQSTFGDVAACERIAREAVLDAHAEGIRVLELQYAPSFASIGHGYAFEDVLSAVQGGVLEGQRQLGGADKIGVGAMGPEEMQKTTDFFLARQDAFCGFDMAGAETNVLQHKECFRKVREAGGRITCHASEDLVEGIPENALNAVEQLGAERIGHGIQIVKDREVMDRLRERDVLLEVSVTSNWLTAAVGPDVSDHPVRTLWEHGIKVQPNTDDPGIMGIDLNNEWHVWKHELGFSDEELDAMQLLALERSFLGQEEKERLWARHFAAQRAVFGDGASADAGCGDTMADAIMRAKEVHCAAARPVSSTVR